MPDLIVLTILDNQNARLAQLVERKTLNLVVVGSSPTVGACFASLPFFPCAQNRFLAFRTFPKRPSTQFAT